MSGEQREKRRGQKVQLHNSFSPYPTVVNVWLYARASLWPILDGALLHCFVATEDGNSREAILYEFGAVGKPSEVSRLSFPLLEVGLGTKILLPSSALRRIPWQAVEVCYEGAFFGLGYKVTDELKAEKLQVVSVFFFVILNHNGFAFWTISIRINELVEARFAWILFEDTQLILAHIARVEALAAARSVRVHLALRSMNYKLFLYWINAIEGTLDHLIEKSESVHGDPAEKVCRITEHNAKRLCYDGAVQLKRL